MKIDLQKLCCNTETELKNLSVNLRGIEDRTRWSKIHQFGDMKREVQREKERGNI